MIGKFGSILVAVVAATVCAGCTGRSSSWAYPHAMTDTLSESPSEHRERVARALEQDRRAIAEDLDLVFMTDRPTRLTRWHAR